MPDLANQVFDAAQGFVRHLEEIDRGLRRAATTVPPRPVKEQAAAHFWALVAAIDSFRGESPETGDESLPRACREILGGWLFRSRYFNRSYHKPHGYAGDFRIVEWMYDLEGYGCEDPTQPGVVNCLHHPFATVHSVGGVWERRHYFAGLLRQEHRRLGGRLRVLDVACGGSRYTRDFLSGLEDVAGVEVTLVDQDPAALAFCRAESLRPWAQRLTTLSRPIKRLAESLPCGDFDVVMSARLFDYLEAGEGRALLAHLVNLTAGAASPPSPTFTRPTRRDPSRTGSWTGRSSTAINRRWRRSSQTRRGCRHLCWRTGRSSTPWRDVRAPGFRSMSCVTKGRAMPSPESESGDAARDGDRHLPPADGARCQESQGGVDDSDTPPPVGRPGLRSVPPQLYQLRPGRWLRDLLIDWVINLAAFFVTAAVHSVWLVPAVSLIIGARLHALALLGHDATHRLAFRSRRLNELVGEVFIAWPLLLVIDHGYRPWHFLHHRSLGTGDDPELSYRALRPYAGAATWWKIALYFVLDMLGFGVVGPARFLWAVFPWGWPRRMVGPVALWAAFLAVTVWCGSSWVFGLWAWSILTGFWAVFRVRTWTEHAALPANGKEMPHRFLAGWLTRFLFFPHNTYCHYEHHKWPQVPYYNLPALWALDRAKPVKPLLDLFPKAPPDATQTTQRGGSHGPAHRRQPHS